ncbi:MAG TPA: hypothetical protein VGB37_16310, partial [Candidatus Lokiarchaeia archaeon]
MIKNNGCSYGRVTRNSLDNLKDSVNKGFSDVIKRLDKLDENQTILFNHKSNFYSPSQVEEIKRMKTINGWLIGII